MSHKLIGLTTTQYGGQYSVYMHGIIWNQRILQAKILNMTRFIYFATLHSAAMNFEMNKIQSILDVHLNKSYYLIVPSLTHCRLWEWRKKEIKLERGRGRGFPLLQGKHK